MITNELSVRLWLLNRYLGDIMASKNLNLNRARKSKNDEFYTKMCTIEDELQWYCFKDKVVYCNCDDFRESNFYKYFKDNFKKLGIKSLYATNFDIGAGSFMVHFDGVEEYVEGVVDGSFSSEGSLRILKLCDVVVTNPPFSLFRSFIDLLVEYEKDFLVLGSLNAVTYKNVFPLIRSGLIKFGTKQSSVEYVTPSGVKTLGNTMWFTTLTHNFGNVVKVKDKNIPLGEFKTFDGTDVINIDRWSDVPLNYTGVMGVPISSIDKVVGAGFEILNIGSGLVEVCGKTFEVCVDGKLKYQRLFIKKIEDE